MARVRVFKPQQPRCKVRLYILQTKQYLGFDYRVH